MSQNEDEDLTEFERSIVKRLIKFEGSVRIQGFIKMLDKLTESERSVMSVQTMYEHLKIEHKLQNQETINKLNKEGGKWSDEQSR